MVLSVPASPSFPVSSSTVSASGTRVLAPTAKGEPGPAEILDPTGTGLPPSRRSTASTPTVSDYKFTVSIRNTGSKTIVAIQWAYLFDSKDSAHEGLAYLFMTKTNIAPGKEKTLTDSVSASGSSKGPTKMPSKDSRSFFNERIAILRLDYADGSSWQSSGTSGSPKKTHPQ
jgi:hypothetical protein